MKPSKLRYHDLQVVLVWEIRTIYNLFKNEQKYEHLLEELKKYDIEDKGPLPYQKDFLKTLDMSWIQLMNLMHELYDDFNKRLSKPKAYQISDTQITICVEIRNEKYIPIHWIPQNSDWKHLLRSTTKVKTVRTKS